MKSATILLFLALAPAACLHAQNQPTAGLPDRDIRQVLSDLSEQSKRLIPILEQIDPRVWVTAKGAPDTYVTQWHSSLDQLKALIGDTATLSKDPEKLSFALQTFFRVQALQYMLQSLTEAIRRYQNGALADLLAGVAAEGGSDRQRFQQYIVNLAVDREQMFGIMDHEAQRCREILSRQGGAAPARTVRK